MSGEIDAGGSCEDGEGMVHLTIKRSERTGS
jgi:hypothetical protein